MICTTQIVSSQGDDGVVSFDIPVRNSLMFNRSLINPTFSFVREQNKFLSLYNKRQWSQFEDAPLTYFASYSGRFGENIGAGISVFQQNFGVLTTFGGVLNFAYNAQLNSDSNLTFGLNIGAYSSGINEGNVVTNFSDPSLQNIPSNFLLSVNPGINYGTTFLDFGVAIKNLAIYNFTTSEMLQDDPNQAIQVHMMYTGYMSSRGFFDDSRFSGLLRSEFTEEETIIAGNAMLYVPKGIWFQAGYNTRYGASAGVGLNITKEIALEYNFETAFGDLVDFGPSHEITLAYRFKKQRYFDYSRQDEVSGLISTNKKPKRRIVSSPKPKTTPTTPIKKDETKEKESLKEVQEKALEKIKQEEATKKLEAQRLEQLKLEKQEADRKAKLEAQRIAREKAERDAARIAKEKEQQRLQAKRIAEEKALREAQQLKEKQLAEEIAKKEAEAKAKLEAEQEALRLEEERIKNEAIKEQEAIANKNTEQELIENPKDKTGKALQSLVKKAAQEKIKQAQLLEQYNKAIEGKNQSLKDLKEENDLSEQGIAVQPKPFKSVTKENEALRSIKSGLDETITSRNQKIKNLEELYEDLYEADTIYNEVVMLYYKKQLEQLKVEQSNANEIKLNLEKRLEDIQIGIEFEKRRRIKRAEFDNEEERYNQDRATLENLKKTTEIGAVSSEIEDFDFGIPQSKNIQILKNVNNSNEGYYLVLAVHSNTNKRNEFITKVLASGVRDIDFFYDVNTSQYYIYQKKFESIQEANNALKERGSKTYNTNMSIIKIEK